MLSTQVILTHFKHIDPQLMDIVTELRNLVAAIKPDTSETVHRKGMTYFDAKRGGHVSAGLCQIVIFPDHIRLAFNHGAFLKDPHGLLVKEGGRIVKRYVKIVNYDDAPWEDLKDLIKESANLDIRSLPIV